MSALTADEPLTVDEIESMAAEADYIAETAPLHPSSIKRIQRKARALRNLAAGIREADIGASTPFRDEYGSGRQAFAQRMETILTDGGTKP